jgi:hypothetical protein
MSTSQKDKLNQIIKETVKDALGIPNNSIKLYHGGTKWTPSDAKVPTPKKGRYESGPGIYLTTNYWTARNYAKGNKIVSIVELEKNIKFANQVKLSKEEAINFVNNLPRLKKKKELINDFIRISERDGYIEAESVINLFVNYEIGAGSIGLELAKWLASKGVDAVLYHVKTKEDWVVVINPKIIKKVIHTKPDDIKEYDFPLVSQQLL